MSVYDSALAAIDWVGNPAPVDLSGNSASIQQSVRAFADIGSTITPASSTIAGWIKRGGTHQTSLLTAFFCGGMEAAFSNGLWIYLSGTWSAATGVSYRYGSTVVGSFPSIVDFSDWQHLAFVNNAGVVTGYINGSSFAIGTLATPQIKGVGLDSESTRKNTLLGAGLAVWDSALSASDITWLATPANRPACPEAGGSSPVTLLQTSAIPG